MKRIKRVKKHRKISMDEKKKKILVIIILILLMPTSYLKDKGMKEITVNNMVADSTVFKSRKYETEEIKVCSDSSVKSYMDYRMITSKSSKQWKYINESGKIKIKDGYLMEDDYIGVALGSYFGEIGSKYIFTLDTGIQLKVVKVEAKDDAHTNNGCDQRWDHSVIEFVVDSKHFEKASNGYVYSGNFNNAPQFKGKIVKIEKVYFFK